MKTRISFQEITPGLYGGLATIKNLSKTAGLDEKLLELVRYRVSQINGCAFCIDMHHKEAIHLGEEELRLHSLPAWRECDFYSDAEKAVLAFAEETTSLNSTELPDVVYDRLTNFFNNEQIIALTAMIVHINSWNRINFAFRPEPGKYQVGQFD